MPSIKTEFNRQAGLDDKQRAKVAQLYRDGLGSAALKERFGRGKVTNRTLDSILEEYNIPKRSRRVVTYLQEPQP